MPHRKKILILIHDDFLRELLGNLLHKDGYFILNGSTIEEGVKGASGNHIDLVILDSDCKDYKDKSSLHYINKELENPEVFLIHDGSRATSYLSKDHQMLNKKLSVREIIQWVEDQQ